MKKSILLGIGACALALGSVAAVLASKSALESKAEDPETYCYVGESSDWNDTSETFVADGTKYPVTIPTGNFKFKVPEDWTKSFGYSDLAGGTKGSVFTAGSGTNIYCNVAGTYNVSFADDHLYIDAISYVYSGTRNEWATSGGTEVTVDGDPVTISMEKNDVFKFKLDVEDNWTGELPFSCLDDDYYDCFVASGTDIKVSHKADYDVGIYLDADHNAKIHITAHNPDTTVFYVLDLNGDLLKAQHRVHAFDGASISTEWPGHEMTNVADTNNIYSIELWNDLTTVQINDGTTKTINYTLSAIAGKCLVLDWAYAEERWTSNTWAELEAAKFVDKYMKFETNHQDNSGSTSGCADNYAAAKAAYNAASFADYRDDFCAINIAKDRMVQWAIANHEEFVITDGVGAFSSAHSFAPLATPESSSTWPAIIIASLAALGVGGLFLLRKHRAE